MLFSSYKSRKRKTGWPLLPEWKGGHVFVPTRSNSDATHKAVQSQ